MSINKILNKGNSLPSVYCSSITINNENNASTSTILCLPDTAPKNIIFPATNGSDFIVANSNSPISSTFQNITFTDSENQLLFQTPSHTVILNVQPSTNTILNFPPSVNETENIVYESFLENLNVQTISADNIIFNNGPTTTTITAENDVINKNIQIRNGLTNQTIAYLSDIPNSVNANSFVDDAPNISPALNSNFTINPGSQVAYLRIGNVINAYGVLNCSNLSQNSSSTTAFSYNIPNNIVLQGYNVFGANLILGLSSISQVQYINNAIGSMNATTYFNTASNVYYIIFNWKYQQSNPPNGYNYQINFNFSLNGTF